MTPPVTINVLNFAHRSLTLRNLFLMVSQLVEQLSVKVAGVREIPKGVVITSAR